MGQACLPYPRLDSPLQRWFILLGSVGLLRAFGDGQAICGLTANTDQAPRHTLTALPSCPQENVQGPRCDQCRLGTFSLDAANPKGCTRCFCFGATDRCQSSTYTRREVCGQDRLGWGGASAPSQWGPVTCEGVPLCDPPVCPAVCGHGGLDAAEQ